MSNWQSAPLSLYHSLTHSCEREGPPFCAVAQHCPKADVVTAFAQTIKRMYSQQEQQQKQQPHGKCAKKEKDQQSNGCARSLRCCRAASAVVVVGAVEVIVFALIAVVGSLRFGRALMELADFAPLSSSSWLAPDVAPSASVLLCLACFAARSNLENREF